MKKSDCSSCFVLPTFGDSIQILFVFFIVLFLAGCNNATPSIEEHRSEEDRNTIIQNMDEQQQAWNKGDAVEFMKHYWKDDSLVFIGKSGLNYGWQTTLDNYIKSYPNKEAMGRLQFTNEVIDVLDTAIAFVIGKWELFRIADTLSGHYSLLWKKANGRWVIVADHSS